MKDLQEYDWAAIELELDSQGAVVLPGLMTAREVDDLLQWLEDDGSRLQPFEGPGAQNGLKHSFGLAEPLPPILASLGRDLRDRLEPIEQRWKHLMGLSSGVATSDPSGTCGATLRADLVTVEEGGFIPLRQGAQAGGAFSFGATIMLSAPGNDFDGGEIAMTEQRPRMQSRPMVIRLAKGDVAVFSGGQRPFKGRKGFYKVTLKSAVGRVRRGRRTAVNLSFAA